MKPLIIANWKMNFSLKEAISYCEELSQNIHNKGVIISPPAPYLAYLADKFSSINFCAQNISFFENNGSYTGEYSASIIKSCGVNYALIGHSERRKLFSETDTIIAKKIENSINAGITPIICIGESIEQRRNGTYKEFILSQLHNSLQIKSIPIYQKLIIAYEPISSIGTGIIPTNDELIQTFEIINSFIKQSAVANKVLLVYGGSVNLDNVTQIVSLKDIDGVLIGNASFNYKNLSKILKMLY
jgi:triosephosphate isomerase